MMTSATRNNHLWQRAQLVMFRMQQRKSLFLGTFAVFACLAYSSSAFSANPTIQAPPKAGDPQYLVVIRHGDRWDYSRPEWKKVAERPGDSPLSILGHQQARETGQFLDKMLSSEGFGPDSITWMASPFLRTLQTSESALQGMIELDTRDIAILPEYSIFEWDHLRKGWHENLPPLQERLNYFPRIQRDYKTMFVPELPESPEEFLERCEKVIANLNEKYPYEPRSAIVMVTHAADSIGLTKAAAGVTLDQINPAGPCSVFRLQRTENTPTWALDDWSKANGFNAYVGHLTDRGLHTRPWNHFGDHDDENGGYTGPPEKLQTTILSS